MFAWQALLVVTAQYDCEPDHPDELEFKEGDKLVVTRKLSKDWWVSEVCDAIMRWQVL